MRDKRKKCNALGWAPRAKRAVETFQPKDTSSIHQNLLGVKPCDILHKRLPLCPVLVPMCELAVKNRVASILFVLADLSLRWVNGEGVFGAKC